MAGRWENGFSATSHGNRLESDGGHSPWLPLQVERPRVRWHKLRVRVIGPVLLLLSGCGTDFLLGRLDVDRPDGGPSAGPPDVGAIAPNPGDTFLVQFGSGPSRWPDDGLLWAFDGWGIEDAEWQPRAGVGALALEGAPELRPGPFTDAAPAVAGAFGATGRLEGPPGAHTFEIVFRAAADGPLVESTAWGDLTLRADQLVWRRGGAELQSAPLAPDAWAHCGAAWAAGQAWIVCNGVAGIPGELPSPAAAGLAELTVAHGEERQLAWLAGHGTDLDPEALRSRFLGLTGLGPTVGDGRVRFPIRATAAALTTFEDGTRWLHRVGLDWPRVGCWDADRCGLWSESGRSPVPFDAWSAEGLELLAEQRWRGSDVVTVAWSASGPGPHVLRRSVSTEATRRVLSFFVSAADPIEVAGTMGALQARFRVGGSAPAPLQLPSSGEGRVEVWDPAASDRAPLHRVVWSQPVPAGELELSIELSPSAGGALAPGRIGAPQLDRGHAGLPVIADQSEDHVSYPGGVNLPDGDAGRIEAVFFAPWLPGPGQSTVVNLSRQGRFGDQINVFIADEGQMLYWGLRDDDSRWGFGLTGAARVDDGRTHRVEARWGPSGATLDVDGATEGLGDADAAGTHIGFDRIDLGNSLESSGPLFGGISVLRIGTP